MNKGAFGGYDKPDFGVKNLTSDMWEPITTTNNFTAYTPEKPIERSQNTLSSGARQTQAKKTASNPAERASAGRRSFSGRYTVRGRGPERSGP